MINLFLRFPDEDAWRVYARSTGVLQSSEQIGSDDGTVENFVLSTHGYAISILGILYNDDAVIDEETGVVITPATPKDGWHVNWKAQEFPAGITAFEVMPGHACQVWAGDPVSKEDREEARNHTTASFAVDESVKTKKATKVKTKNS